jgi:protein SMG5
MHHMGQLWLRAEVRDLESRVRHRCATFSPYLAVDSDALIYHMHLVKQLVGARKFIILIPSVGMYTILTSEIFCKGTQ